MKTWIPDSRNFAYLNWKQVDALPRESTLLVLPTASIEQHGHHLPIATDTLINNLLLGHALGKLPPRMPIFALPPVHYGKSNEHVGFPGTLSVSATTFMAVVHDVGSSLSSSGFKRLVLYNTHGGNTSLVDVMARDLRAEFGLAYFCIARLRRHLFRRLKPARARLRFSRGRSRNRTTPCLDSRACGSRRVHIQLHRGHFETGDSSSRRRGRHIRLAYP